MRLPKSTLRLFPSYEPHLFERTESRPFVVGRLLEEGDRHDLAWLASEVDESELVRWVEERGARQLSRRSLSFWSRLLRIATDDVDAALWPL